METKTCFKCHRELPLSEFYKHSGMADGHLNKCKECAKKDVHEKYIQNIANPQYVEKERARGREKYRRLGYVTHKMTHGEIRNASRKLRKLYDVSPDFELHHWNYNFVYDVIILDRRTHARLHKAIVFDEQTKCFRYNGVLLDTKEKHEQIIKQIKQ